MKKTIIAILILVIAFLVYNFAPTGYTVLDGQETIIKISPIELKQGQKLLVTIEPIGPRGVDREMTLHSKNHLRKDTTDAWGTDCANYKRGSTKRCQVPWTFNYELPKTMTPGEYYLRFYDYDVDEFIRSDYFTIVE